MRSKIKALRERNQQIAAEARQMRESLTEDSTEAEIREIDDRFDRAMADFDKNEAEAERLEKLVQIEARAASYGDRVDETRRPGAGGEVRGNEEDAEASEQRKVVVTPEQAFTMAVRFGASSLPAEHRNLIRMSAEIPQEIRAQGVGTDSAGGFTVPEGFQAEITKSMALWGPMLDGNITRVLDTATGNTIPWPTVDDTANVGALLAENTAEGEQDVTFGQKTLDAYKYSSDIVRVSLELLQDSAFNMDQLLSELFGERLGRIGNTALTTGTGTAQPNGIVTASSLGKTAASATAITMDELIDLLHSVDPAYRGSPRARWMFNDTTLSAIRKLKDGNSNYIWQPADARSGEPATLLGYPYSVNQAMSSIATGNRTVVFGDLNKYVVRRVRDFTLLRLSERYADFYQVGFLAFSRIDGELMDTAAVKHLKQA